VAKLRWEARLVLLPNSVSFGYQERELRAAVPRWRVGQQVQSALY
jgi:hypothetical protein